MPRKTAKKPTTQWTTCSEGVEYKKLRNGETLYRVRWIEGGGGVGPRADAYFDGHTAAKNFRGELIANGRRDPRKNHVLTDAVAAHAPQAAEASDSDAAPTITFGRIIDEYLGGLRKAKARQVSNYLRQFDLHVRAATVTVRDVITGQTRKVGPLGGLPIDQITTAVIDAWVSYMEHRTYVYRKARPARRTRDGELIPAVKEERRPYSAKTIHNIHGGVISPGLAWAARGGVIPVNPCIGVELPELDAQAVSLDEVPTGDEIAEWIELGYEVSELAGDIVSVVVGTGLRWSELTALRPCDIDLKARTLRVSQVVKEDEDRVLYLAPFGKTESALRTIRFGKELKPILKRLCKNRGPRELIFQRPTGGILHSAGFYETHWKKVVERARERGITTRATIHKFRHSHATMLLAANISMDSISKRLGHKNIVITTTLYSHLDPGRDTAAADVMDAVMRRRGGKAKRDRKSKDNLGLAA